MIGWIRNAVIIFAILTVVYAVLTTLARIRQKDRLKNAFLEEKTTENKQVFVEKGMEKYNRSLRAKLFLFVYLIPFAVFALLMYLALYT